MNLRSQFPCAALALFGAIAATAQVQAPLDSSVLRRHTITDTQARVLSKSFEDRAATKTLIVHPEALRQIVETQPPPVDVGGTIVAPTTEVVAVPTPPEPSGPAPTRVEYIQTNARDEALLERAIASQDSLQHALSVKDSSLIPLSGIVRMSTEGGADLQLKPFILVNQPLQRVASGVFEGELLVGVTEIIDSGVTRQLPAPLLFQIVGAVKSIPDRVLVDTTSPPFQRVRVTLNTVQNRAAELLVVSAIDRQGTRISLPLEGQLNVETASGAIEGLGLATTKVHVNLTGSDNPEKRRVTLHVEPSGFLQPSVIALDAEGNGEAELRSDWIGTATIKATSAGLQAATTSVTYQPPWLTFGAAVIGGLLGAFVSFATQTRRKRRPGLRLIGSAVFGVIVFALYVIGINLLPVKPQVTVGAAFVFAITALAAWLGPTISSWRKQLPSV